MTTQQREHVRFRLEVACELDVHGEIIVAKTTNLSVGGAAVLCRAKLTPGDVYSVVLFLTQDGIEDANRRPVELTASIRWTQPRAQGQSIIGMQFISPTQAQRNAIEDFLRKISSGPA